MLPWQSVILDLEKLDQVLVCRRRTSVLLALALRASYSDWNCSRLGLTVVLLEGGGDSLEQPSQDLYDSDVHGLPHAGIHEGRFRTFGGTTIRWGGQILELDELDFKKRAWGPE